MIIKVKWLRACLSQLENWVASQAQTRTDAENYVTRYVDLIEADLVRFQGHPPGSFTMRGLSPAPIVWEINKDRLWIVFVVKDRGGVLRKLLRRGCREITLLRIGARLPDARSLLLPPS
jgi:hypothetical protein